MYMKIGDINDRNEVLKLQSFMKNTEGYNVDLTGIFDTKTESAVKNFQAKYLTDTMGPWKNTIPTGYVYITTKKKINEIACGSTINFTSDESFIINNYNQNSQNDRTPTTTVSTESTTTAPVVTEIIGSNISTSSANTASVVNAPIIQRIWNFFKGLF